ncbi:hypothetical protein OEZ85_004905 [Tetradesmus obliquus]|uniref:RWP-RK domain-containing protein n=1 Tax=Tetradesmus obliquus TaxID=3088 RepID=A0ABY8UJP6_TETOB|nr:hypothetical protein OEZ85_004905 [Tetradesmus obliquus]
MAQQQMQLHYALLDSEAHAVADTIISAAADHGFDQRAAAAALPAMLQSTAEGMTRVAASRLDSINQQETEQLLAAQPAAAAAAAAAAEAGAVAGDSSRLRPSTRKRTRRQMLSAIGEEAHCAPAAAAAAAEAGAVAGDSSSTRKCSRRQMLAGSGGQALQNKKNDEQAQQPSDAAAPAEAAAAGAAAAAAAASGGALLAGASVTVNKRKWKDGEDNEIDRPEREITVEALRAVFYLDAEAARASLNVLHLDAEAARLSFNVFALDAEAARASLNVGKSVFQAAQRELGIERWPYRKIMGLRSMLSYYEAVGPEEDVAWLRELEQQLMLYPNMELLRDGPSRHAQLYRRYEKRDRQLYP